MKVLRSVVDESFRLMQDNIHPNTKSIRLAYSEDVGMTLLKRGLSTMEPIFRAFERVQEFTYVRVNIREDNYERGLNIGKKRRRRKNKELENLYV